MSQRLAGKKAPLSFAGLYLTAAGEQETQKDQWLGDVAKNRQNSWFKFHSADESWFKSSIFWLLTKLIKSPTKTAASLGIRPDGGPWGPCEVFERLQPDFQREGPGICHHRLEGIRVIESGFVLFLGPQNDKLYNANTSSETDILVPHRIFAHSGG